MDRRKFARIQVDLKLQFRSLEALENLIDADAADISMGGMFIHTSVPKPLGTRVEIGLPVPGGGMTTVVGVVRRIIHENGNFSGMGIEFQDLVDPALGIIQYLVSKNSGRQGK